MSFLAIISSTHISNVTMSGQENDMSRSIFIDKKLDTVLTLQGVSATVSTLLHVLVIIP